MATTVATDRNDLRFIGRTFQVLAGGMPGTVKVLCDRAVTLLSSSPDGAPENHADARQIGLS
ncbi:hypothetical protein [Rhizobacter sp. SG703]|uniref:hypothetical protein n=1 Tax=Rhizobacter sp. SG703 TaxID=2587140 RepID=UPI0014453DB8|nr:hypothetical protein [Rhizobacter sp. SG703]